VIYLKMIATYRDVFVDLNAESQRDLLSDSRAAPGRIPLLHFNNRVQ